MAQIYVYVAATSECWLGSGSLPPGCSERASHMRQMWHTLVPKTPLELVSNGKRGPAQQYSLMVQPPEPTESAALYVCGAVRQRCLSASDCVLELNPAMHLTLAAPKAYQVPKPDHSHLYTRRKKPEVGTMNHVTKHSSSDGIALQGHAAATTQSICGHVGAILQSADATASQGLYSRKQITHTASNCHPGVPAECCPLTAALKLLRLSTRCAYYAKLYRCPTPVTFKGMLPTLPSTVSSLYTLLLTPIILKNKARNLGKIILKMIFKMATRRSTGKSILDNP